MRVDEHALDVGEVGVVLQRTHVQPRLLAQLRDAGAVVVRELARRQDGIRNLHTSIGRGQQHRGTSVQKNYDEQARSTS